MDRLYSPWRLSYVTTASEPVPGCIFCNAAAAEHDDPLVVARGRSAFVILNLYPYNSGHLMIVPNRHVASLAELSPEERADVMDLTARAEVAVTEVYRPQGLNIGVNLGKAAGAGILDHLHLHIVPRWSGDTNFMPILTGTRVLGEGLRALYDKLIEAQAKIDAESRQKT